MQKYKKMIPIVAVVLIALGVNLDKFGVDLEALSEQGATQSQTQSPNQSPSQSSGQLAEAWRGGPEPKNSATNNANNSANNQTKRATTSSNRSSNTPVKLPHWSNTTPEINLWHVFEGEINRKGKPTGFHSRPGGLDPVDARVVSIKDRPNRQGVYTANIEVRDGRQWKSKFSSFFPDNLSQQEVVEVILNAYNNSSNPNKQPWSGPSGLGFQVQGYTTSRGGINTAFPVYKRN